LRMSERPVAGRFLLVCLAELVAGGLLWTCRRAGVVLALVLLPFEFALWLDFALPFGPPFGAACTALVLLGWFAADARMVPPPAALPGTGREGPMTQSRRSVLAGFARPAPCAAQPASLGLRPVGISL
jgi:hypothetical protein